MHELDKQMNTVRTQLGRWAKKAKQEYPGHLEDTVRHAVDKLDPTALARASQEVVATVTGNRKAARRARKSVEHTLRRAQRKIGTGHARGRGMRGALGVVAVIGLVAAIAIRKATAPRGGDPASSRNHSSKDSAQPHKQVDPDMGS